LSGNNIVVGSNTSITGALTYDAAELTTQKQNIVKSELNRNNIRK
jgi:hypothetical protein